tara:strand:+ start:85 stop:399 length:315 start_codon:yes stop_codon:yes gene_type:complete
MNTQPEQLLKQIKEGQMQVKAYQAIVDAKKELLEQYFEKGFIMSRFEIDGIKAVRRRKPEKWQYTEELINYKKEINNAIEDREQQEREEGIATKIDTGTSWVVR